MLIKADNQPIQARPTGEAIWITDLITPNNPDIILKYRELTAGLDNNRDIITALWRYVASLPYKPTIAARIIAGRVNYWQQDTWFYPAETMKVGVSNCANRSFLLASLLKSYLTQPGDVYVVMGELRLDNIGSHAWVQIQLEGSQYYLETTQPNIPNIFIPVSNPIYVPAVYFDEEEVYTVNEGITVAQVLNSVFGLCAIEFLRNYLCEHCLEAL